MTVRLVQVAGSATIESDGSRAYRRVFRVVTSGDPLAESRLPAEGSAYSDDDPQAICIGVEPTYLGPWDGSSIYSVWEVAAVYVNRHSTGVQT